METKTRTRIKDHYAALLATALFSFFIIGLLFPESWWGVHFLKFVSPILKVICIAAALGSIGYAWYGGNKKTFTSLREETAWPKWLVFGGGFIASLIFLNFPIAGDIYGNSRGFQPILETTVKDLPSDFYSNLFSFEFVPGNGRGGVTLIVEWISYAFQVTIYDAFKIMDAICGGLFVAIWLWSVQHFVKVKMWRIIVASVGLTSPFLIIYFGHVETYAPVYLILFVWLLLFVLFMRTKKAKYYWALLPLLIIGIRLHTLMYLVVPAFVIASLYKFEIKSIILEKARHIKSTFMWMYVPMFIGGLILYFFVFKDYNDPRVLTDFKDIDRLFLPMVSPDPPLDNYNMFSLAHLLDFFNMILFWSPVLLLLLGYIVIAKGEQVNWKLPELNVLVLTVFLFGTILFAMNPLFSMPMDWDLFCFPVPILLLVLLLLVGQIETEKVRSDVPVVSGGLMLLCIPAFSVFLNLQQNSIRAERVGVHIYKTYYEHSSTYLLMSLKMVEGDEQYHERMSALIKELEPNALPEKDKQYAELLVDMAYFKFQRENNPVEARKYLLKSMEYERLQDRFDPLAFEVNRTLVQEGFLFSAKDKEKANTIIDRAKILLREEEKYEEAYRDFRYSRYYDPLNGRAILFSVEALFRMKRYPEAFDFALDLIGLRYPDYPTALRIGIHSALEANRYGDALRYCNTYLQNFEQDETIITIKQRLDAREKVEELKFLFNRGE